ncbi:integral membrane-like protein [Caulobacter sp. RHG1]|uniref:integral membrane-like protein n=1 Tax=Caulobacter sp. (strain RHG1) TaxID=2545762 RepID=UPI0015520B8D|nr:integral membrane-like protein [Caulobacter sp. RHG1]NQE63213.1 hypothetical protein [Caulobacter sp. RHG1]
MPGWTQPIGTRRELGLLVLAAVILCAPGFLWGPGESHSWIYNILWTHQVAEGFCRGELYPRWFPESFSGLGSPTFYFYAPFAHWIAGGLEFLGLSTQRAVQLLSFGLLLGSGLAMYAWLRFRRTLPLLGAILYMAAPYHLADLYVRGALAEAAGFIWLPLIALGIELLPRRKGVVLLAMAFAGLILSHLPTALLACVFLILPLAIWRAAKAPAIVAPGIAAAALGAGLSAIYWLPAMTLQGHISTDLLWSPYYQPASWFVWRLSLLNLALFAGAALGWTLLAVPSRSFWSWVTLVAALAALGLIPFLWDLPLLAKAQFPWRLLVVVEFAAITAVMAHPPRGLALSAGRIVLVVPVAMMIAQAAVALRAQPDAVTVLAIRSEAPEYLPHGLPAAGVSGTQRTADVSAYDRLPRSARIEIHAAGPVTLGRAAFPIWRVTRDGQEIPSHGPLITFEGRPGVYQVERRVLWQERWGGLASGAAALVLLVLLGLRRKR